MLARVPGAAGAVLVAAWDAVAAELLATELDVAEALEAEGTPLLELDAADDDFEAAVDRGPEWP